MHKGPRDIRVSEQNKFINDLTFNNPGVGKIILYIDTINVVHLAGHEVKHLGASLKKDLERKSDAEILDYAKALLSKPAFMNHSGFHKDIPHSGRVTGGAVGLLYGTTLYVVGSSKDFGDISQEAVSECLAGGSLRALF